MNKKQLEQTYSNIKTFVNRSGEDIMAWLKKHKKLVIVGGLLYLAFSYLFDEGEEE